MKNGRITRHAAFLIRVLRNSKPSIQQASFKELGLLVEIVYNLLNGGPIYLSPKEHAQLANKLAQLQLISKTRNPERAKELLLKLDQTTLRSVINPVLAAYGLK